MKIVQLAVNNVLAIKAITIRPDGETVTLGGENGAGKSSVLNSIAMALGGKRLVPEQPIRQGEERGTIRLDLGDYVVERVFTAGGDRIEVKSRDGAKYPKPQAMLDALCASIAFDPLQFALEKDAAKQGATLRQLVGLDLTDLDAKKRQAFDARADVNREAKALAAQIAAMPPRDDSAPAAPVSVEELATRLEACKSEEAQQERIRSVLAKSVDAAKAAQRRVSDAADAIAQLERQLRVARSEHEAATAALKQSQADVATGEAKVASLVSPDTAAARQALADVERVNAAVRANAARAKAKAKAADLDARSQAFSAELEAIEAERTARIACAPFPVEGLGFSDSGVTYRGLPFAQASSAEKLRVSVAVAVAMNPKLRVCLVRDGSLLSPKSIEQLHQLASDYDCQLWIEDARTTDPSAIIIEAGEIASGKVAAE